MIRKILSSVLCLLLVASTMFTVACAGEGGTESGSGSSSNQSGTSTEKGYGIPPDAPDPSKPNDDLLKANFEDDDGKATTITFAFAESADDNFTERSIWIDPDKKSDKPVDAAIEIRNATICSKLGVEIDAFRAADSIQGLQSAISTSMSSGEEEIDVIVGYQYFDINIATQGWVMNLADMVDDYRNNAKINYLNYDTKAYWGTDYIDALSYKGIVFWVTGDLSLRFVGGVYCTYVNKTLYEKYVAPVYTDKEGSLYDIVDRGDWTMEKLYTMSNLIYENLDGNDEVTKDDVVGFAWEANDPVDGLAFGCQVPFSTKSSSGDVTITLNSSRTTDFVRELEKLLYDQHSVRIDDNDSNVVMPLFTSGTVGFTVNKLFQAERYDLPDMEDDYMIVPVPKLNGDQKKYTTGIHDGCSIYGISYFSDAKTAAAATLEYMAYLSHKDVLPVYYNQALKNMYTNDEASGRMIDLIHDNVNTDFAAAWSNSIQNIVWWFRTHNKTTRFTSDLNRFDGAHKIALENLIKDLEEFAKA